QRFRARLPAQDPADHHAVRGGLPRPAPDRRVPDRRRAGHRHGGGAVSDQSGQERTEKATPKRMKELRRDGSLQRSQDLSAWLGIGAGGLMLPFVLRSGSAAAEEQMTTVQRVIENPTPELAVAALGDGLG